MWRFLFSKAADIPRVRPSPTLFFCLVGAFVLTLVPHIQQLPIWVSLGVAVTIVFRSVGEIRRWPLPSSGFCGVLALCLLAGIFVQFNTVLGRDAGTAFMAGLLAIKFFELRGPRDVALVIFSSFFLVMSSLLYSQAIELFIYCLIMMWVLTALLIRTGRGDLPDDHLLHMLRGAALIFFQALPFAVFLFFFFPRYHGVLQMGMQDSAIGLTDKLEPGSISRLSDDDSTAMTAKISGLDAPLPSAMYWRALVLWNYRQGAWTPGNASFVPRNKEEALPPAARVSLVNQEITIWPHLHRWLFALDYPVSLAVPVSGANGWSEAVNGGVLQLTSSVLNRKERYDVSSAPEIGAQDLKKELRMAALELPGDDASDRIDPRVRALAAQLEKGCANEDDYIRAVLHYFRQGGFVYSESPGTGTLANFLFHTRKGFCEHYASAFGVLMRLGHYPARLVVGYHGAQFNPYSGLYIVRQSDAHSWDEVWIEEEKRWRRVDPTTAISNVDDLSGSAPTAQEPAAANESISIDVAHHRITFVSSAYLPRWFRRGMLEMQLRRQEIEASWDDWVFSYDPQAQERLAQALGLSGEVRYVLALACLAAAGICAIVFGTIMRRRRNIAPVEIFYVKLCRSLAQRGVPRALWEGPLAYSERAAEAFPNQATAIRKAGRVVAQARYGAAPSAPARDELKSLLLSIAAPRVTDGDRHEDQPSNLAALK